MQSLNDYAVKQKSKTYDSYTRMMAEEWDASASCRAYRELEALYGEVTDAKSKQELQLADQKAARSRQKAHYLYFLGNIHFQLERFPEAAGAMRKPSRSIPGTPTRITTWRPSSTWPANTSGPWAFSRGRCGRGSGTT